MIVFGPSVAEDIVPDNIYTYIHPTWVKFLGPDCLQSIVWYNPGDFLSTVRLVLATPKFCYMDWVFLALENLGRTEYLDLHIEPSSD